MQRELAIIQNDPEVPAGVFGELLTEWRVPFRIVRPDLGELLPAAGDAAIVLGGAMGVHDEAAHPFLREIKGWLARLLADGTPLLGICLGGQLLAEVAGGMVSSNRCGEKGLVEVELTGAGAADPLFAGIPRCFPVFQWHNDSFTIPPGAAHLAGSRGCPGQAFRTGNAWGVQFHPEVDGAIVAAWSRKTPDAARLTGRFAAAEAGHRALARQLLANFLDAARPGGR
ncbi:MAG: type 1 glutamine amidotransferase [Deltaproteobacteria bacterium]|nr:MAG: type 1 glutamine amidotransferase [Deltaproteobacteria bacterium]